MRQKLGVKARNRGVDEGRERERLPGERKCASLVLEVGEHADAGAQVREQQLANQRRVASRPPSELGERGVGGREDGHPGGKQLRKLLAQPAEAQRVAQRLEARLPSAAPKVGRGAQAGLRRRLRLHGRMRLYRRLNDVIDLDAVEHR